MSENSKQLLAEWRLQHFQHEIGVADFSRWGSRTASVPTSRTECNGSFLPGPQVRIVMMP